ncbi:MAG: monovalent cation/H(+) antiporter subunit G [Thermodesulfobacteriota bacterium]
MSILTTIALICGLFIYTGGAVGILRFPDFYSRLHPAGKLDTLGLLLSMIAAALYVIQQFSLASVLIGIKILLIAVFVFVTSPIATHAIVDAGVRANLIPWTKPEGENIK